MKIKRTKNIIQSVFSLMLIVVLLLSVAAWRGQLLGHSLKANAAKDIAFSLDLETCRGFFAEAHEVQKENAFQFNILDKTGEILGFAFAGKGEKGYGGRVPLFVFTNANDIVCGLTLGKNFESQEYRQKVIDAGILSRWNGIPRTEVASVAVDATSGATFTEQAIILGVQNVASNQQFTPPFRLFTAENGSALLLLLVLTFACFFPKKIMKYRNILQVLSIVVFGFWLSRLLSFVQIVNWLSGGVNWRIHFILLVVLALSVFIPLVFGRAFYCTWVCPFGAAQELCGKACSRKVQFPEKTNRFLKSLRERIFIVLLVLLWTGFTFDLTLIEPFSAFSVKTVSYWMLGFAGLFLVISLFIPKVWCRYFCPTGFLLEWIRK